MTTDQKFYAHFNKDTKQIYSVGNSFSKTYHKHSVEITFKQYTDFVDGVIQTHSFIVDRKKLNGKLTSILVPMLGAEETASKNVYTIIESKPTKATDLVVSWEPSCWTFRINEVSKKAIEDMNDVPLLFFVVDSNNLSRLFRTITISCEDLSLNNSVTVQSSCKEEENINSIKIVTRAVFKKYGLEIND